MPRTAATDPSPTARTAPRGARLPPPLPRPCLARPRLVAAAREGLAAGLLRVEAGAGYGKTTLLAQALEGRDATVAWVACDPRPGRPGVVDALAAALAGALPGLAVPARRARPERRAAALCDEIAGAGGEVVIVLDDAHLLVGGRGEAELRALARELPPAARLAVASRWALGELLGGARPDAVALGEAELALAPEEARELLAALGSDASADEAAERSREAEGWMAGVVLSARPGGDALDYLLREVVDPLPEPAARLLEDTSHLDRFTPAMAAHVAGRDDAAELLALLDDRRAFLVPAPGGPGWRRHHRTLRAALERRAASRPAAQAAELHRRAAEAWNAIGEPEPAARHHLAAGDLSAALGGPGRHRRRGAARRGGLAARRAPGRVVGPARARAGPGVAALPPGRPPGRLRRDGVGRSRAAGPGRSPPGGGGAGAAAARGAPGGGHLRPHDRRRPRAGAAPGRRALPARRGPRDAGAAAGRVVPLRRGRARAGRSARRGPGRPPGAGVGGGDARVRGRPPRGPPRPGAGRAGRGDPRPRGGRGRRPAQLPALRAGLPLDHPLRGGPLRRRPRRGRPRGRGRREAGARPAGPPGGGDAALRAPGRPRAARPAGHRAGPQRPGLPPPGRRPARVSPRRRLRHAGRGDRRPHRGDARRRGRPRGAGRARPAVRRRDGPRRSRQGRRRGRPPRGRAVARRRRPRPRRARGGARGPWRAPRWWPRRSTGRGGRATRPSRTRCGARPTSASSRSGRDASGRSRRCCSPAPWSATSGRARSWCGWRAPAAARCWRPAPTARPARRPMPAWPWPRPRPAPWRPTGRSAGCSRTPRPRCAEPPAGRARRAGGPGRARRCAW